MVLLVFNDDDVGGGASRTTQDLIVARLSTTFSSFSLKSGMGGNAQRENKNLARTARSGPPRRGPGGGQCADPPPHLQRRVRIAPVGRARARVLKSMSIPSKNIVTRSPQPPPSNSDAFSFNITHSSS